MATNAAAQNAIKKKLVHKLEVSTGQRGSRVGVGAGPGQQPGSQSFLERRHPFCAVYMFVLNPVETSLSSQYLSSIPIFHAHTTLPCAADLDLQHQSCW